MANEWLFVWWGAPWALYIRPWGITCGYDNYVLLSNSELTELISLLSFRFILVQFRRLGVLRGGIGSMLQIMFESIEPSGLELIQSCIDPFCQWFLPWPTKGWPCEITGPESFVRPSSLLVDSGDICPPQAPNLWVDFETIAPKILGPACSFDFRMWMLWQYTYQVVASELWSVR
jgi:hypothetical protein